jgi:hypothetical protein
MAGLVPFFVMRRLLFVIARLDRAIQHPPTRRDYWMPAFAGMTM